MHVTFAIHMHLHQDEHAHVHVPRLFVAEARASVQAAAPGVCAGRLAVADAQREHVPRAARDAHHVHAEQHLHQLRTLQRVPIAVACATQRNRRGTRYETKRNET